eukprot:sb/3460788/
MCELAVDYLSSLVMGMFRNWSEKKNEAVKNTGTEFVARDYQLEMLERAKKENSIVMLPTGAGKTYVAVLLIRHFLHEVFTDPLWEGNRNGDPNWKRTFFLVNQVTLVGQQAKVLRSHLGVQVAEISGNSKNVDNWDKASWYQQFKKSQLFVMTAAIFRDLLANGFIKASNVNVLILDECHHVKKNHTMTVIMRDYWNVEQPPGRVLGLTASVVDEKNVNTDNTRGIEQLINNLQAILKARLITPKEFTFNETLLPSPEIRRFETGKYGIHLLTCLSNIETVFAGVDTKDLPVEEQSPYRHIKKFATSLPKIIREVGVDSLLTYLTSDRGLIVELDNLLCNEILAPIEVDGKVEKRFTYMIGEVLKNRLQQLSNIAMHVLEEHKEVRMAPKFYSLVKLILELQATSNNTSRIIVFIETRRVVQAMYSYIRELAEKVKSCQNMKVAYVLGGTSSGEGHDRQNMSEFEFAEMEVAKKKQERALLNFREGKCNILLATSVVEEGLDIPACNVVVRYDFPQTYRAFVQSRGRARQKPARFVFFIPEHEMAERKMLLDKFNKVEKLLTTFAASSGEELDLDDVEDSDYSRLIPPLQIEGSPAKITAIDCIQRLNFYCEQLPKDEYTSNRPVDTLEGGPGGYTTTIVLPKLCPIDHPIKGDRMPNKKLAKMSAARNALWALWEAGELSDVFLPIFRQKESDTLPIESEEGRTVTVDQKLKVPTIFWRKDLGSQELFLYSIRVSLEPNSPDFKEYFVQGKSHKVVCFGIITTEKLPEPFPVFDVFPRYGTVTVRFMFEKTLEVPPASLNRMKWFQEALFIHTLDIKALSSILNARFKDFLVVPLCMKRGLKKSATLEVDTRFIEQLRKQWDSEHNHWKFGNVPAKEEDCVDCVLFAHYKFPQHHNNQLIGSFLYVVEGVSETMTAESKLQGKREDGMTYLQYHKEKGQEITRPEQKLLTARNVTRHYEYLSGGKAGQYKINMLIVGEIHQVHPMPSSLWNQATCLPSILWRLETCLLAHELTNTLYKETDLTITLLASKYNDYFREEVSNLMAKLQRNQRYTGPIDWLETLHAITHKACKSGFSLERLEYLGDRFLKFVSTLYYYRVMPDKHEGWLSRFRSEMVCNKNLAIRCSRTLSLPRYILNKNVDPGKHWIPPTLLPERVVKGLTTAAQLLQNPCDAEGLTDKEKEQMHVQRKSALQCAEVDKFLRAEPVESVEESLEKLCDLIPDELLQRLSIKDIADSMESLIGLCVSRYGYKMAVELIDKIAISTFEGTEGGPRMLGDYLYQPTPAPVIYSKSESQQRIGRARCRDLSALQEALGYTFREPLYLLEAVTHATFTDIDVCYQRLEFLGDAVLDVLMVFKFYEEKPGYDQGELSKLLSSLVCNTTLSKVCIQLGIHRYLLYTSPELYSTLARFYANFEEQELTAWVSSMTLERVIVGSIASDTLEEQPVVDLDSKVVQAPKLLGDLVEAVIGAIYLDCGEDMEVVWRVIWPWFSKFYNAYRDNPPQNPRDLVNLKCPGNRREVIDLPGNQFKVCARVKIGGEYVKGKPTPVYEFVTTGRDRETAMDVCFGRAWVFYKNFLDPDRVVVEDPQEGTSGMDSQEGPSGMDPQEGPSGS